MNIAMWSGPRNLSTALMYSFGARPDCAVWDEPYYAAYLARTGLDHPMAAEILATYDQDPARIAARCQGPAPQGRTVFYQKHMTQHMLPGFDLAWLAQVTNVFLIRHPARVIASYHAKRENPTLEDVGFPRQADLFTHVARLTGTLPPVLDSADLLRSPEAMLRRLCQRIGLAFDPAMLTWPSGGHPQDGLWAPVWYQAVHASTGFGDPPGPLPEVPPDLVPVLEASLPLYEALKAHAITPDDAEDPGVAP